MNEGERAELLNELDLELMELSLNLEKDKKDLEKMVNLLEEILLTKLEKEKEKAYEKLVLKIKETKLNIAKKMVAFRWPNSKTG